MYVCQGFLCVCLQICDSRCNKQNEIETDTSFMLQKMRLNKNLKNHIAIGIIDHLIICQCINNGMSDIKNAMLGINKCMLGDMIYIIFMYPTYFYSLQVKSSNIKLRLVSSLGFPFYYSQKKSAKC